MGQTFWQNDSVSVARDLLGKTLIIGSVEGTILETQGYNREENTGIYKPVTTMNPGEVYCPRQRNSILFLLTTKDGGCVLVRTVEVNGSVYSGPGKSTKALGINDPRVIAETEWFDEDSLFVRFKNLSDKASISLPDRCSPRVIPKETAVKELLRHLMPQIIEVYLKVASGGFNEFVNGLLETCSTKDAFIEALKAMSVK